MSRGWLLLVNKGNSLSEIVNLDCSYGTGQSLRESE